MREPKDYDNFKGVMTPRCMQFTICNCTDDDIINLRKLPATYIVFGRKICPTTGTPHLQGFLQMKSITVKAMMKKIPKIKFAPVCNNSTSDNIAEFYKKEYSNYYEHGSITKQAKQTNIADMREMGYEGLSTVKIRRENDAEIRYPFALQQLSMDARLPSLPKIDLDLRPWQIELINILNGPVHPRNIYFYVDYIGAAGKTTFAKYISTTFEHVQIMKPTTYPNMAYMLDEKTKIMIIDCPRSAEYIPYQFFEDVKDGRVESTKYKPIQKRIKCHLVVFMSIDPSNRSLDKFINSSSTRKECIIRHVLQS